MLFLPPVLPVTLCLSICQLFVPRGLIFTTQTRTEKQAQVLTSAAQSEVSKVARVPVVERLQKAIHKMQNISYITLSLYVYQVLLH